MKNNATAKAAAGTTQKGKEIKTKLPVKNKMTSTIKNIASQIPGLNQANITRDDLLPSDGDNLTI